MWCHVNYIYPVIWYVDVVGQCCAMYRCTRNCITFGVVWWKQRVVMITSLALIVHPDSKVHGANMGPIWGRQDPNGPHVGPMNFAIWANSNCIIVDLGGSLSIVIMMPAFYSRGKFWSLYYWSTSIIHFHLVSLNCCCGCKKNHSSFMAWIEIVAKLWYVEPKFDMFYLCDFWNDIVP